MTTSSQPMWPGSPTREHGAEPRAIPSGSILHTRVLPGVLLLIFAAQCLWFVGTQSFTVDEPFNLAVGIKHWRGVHNQGNDNPPLVRMLCALPLLRSQAADIAASEFELDQPVDPIAVAWRTRPMNLLLGLLLAVAVWNAARRRFSAGAANWALALFVFSPPLIAYYSIIGTDGIAALMIFITALQVAAFRRNPSWQKTAVTGVVLGLLLLAKLYTLPMFALALLLVALPSPAHLRFWRWGWGKALVMAAISFALLWSCYRFRVSDVVVRDHQAWLEDHGTVESRRYPSPVNFNFSFPLPAGDFAASILDQLEHGRQGHEAYLLGKVSEHGWRYYFPVAVALKWPTVVLLLGLVTAVPVALRRIRLPQDFGIIFLFPLSFFALALFSTVNIGERYVLTVYPFVLLFVAALFEHVRQFSAGESTRRDNVTEHVQGSPGAAPGPAGNGRNYAGRMAVAVLVCAAAVNAADALRYAPDYLSYFTVFIRPQQSWRYLSDSSLDWGQGLIALRHYEQQHSGEKLHVAYFTNGIGPDRYGVEATPFGENERPSGGVIVSPGVLSGQYNDEQEAFRWVLRYPLKGVLNHNLLVFEIPSGAE